MVQSNVDMHDYSRVEKYLDDFVNYEVLPGFGFASAGYTLDHVESVLHDLGEPHKGPLTVHVAGSKGKGSVSAMVASALSACGYRTGLYTSPHLSHLGERIVVDGEPVTPEELESALAIVRPRLEASLSDENARRLTYFEILTIMAFVHFRECRVDAQVVEVGLGGRLDATNVVRSDVCVITPISLEHTAVLGDTVEKIAFEKAGIIKHGATTVSSLQQTGVMDVIEQACRERHSPLVRVGHDVTWSVKDIDEEGQTVRLETSSLQSEVHIPLLGSFQAENAATAFAGIQALGSRGVHFEAACIVEGFSRVKWPGRFDILARAPLLVLDGAHNPASMRRLVESVSATRSGGPLVFVLGFSSDKDIQGAVSVLGELAPRIVLTRSSQPRASAPADVAARISALGLQVVCEESPLSALKRARNITGGEGAVCVAGSLYLVGDVLRAWEQDDNLRTHWQRRQ